MQWTDGTAMDDQALVTHQMTKFQKSDSVLPNVTDYSVLGKPAWAIR